MKMRLCTAVFILFLSAFNVDGQEVKFGWNAGAVNLYVDVLHNEPNLDYEVLYFRWLINKNFSIGFNVINIYDSFYFFGMNDYKGDARAEFSILPLEIAYVPVNLYDQLFFSIYGKAGFLKLYENSGRVEAGFYGSFGVQLYFFPETYFYYSPYLSLFAEYDTLNKLKIGIGVDLGGVLAVILKIVQGASESSYRKDSRWEERPN